MVHANLTTAFRTLILILGLSILSCNTPNSRSDERLNTTEPDYKVAIQFINDYIDYCNDHNSEVGIIDWVNSRKDVTSNFKTELKKILTVADRQDPDLGLGFDPILDAQDYPDKLEIDYNDSAYLVVKGIDWPEFRLTLKLRLVGNIWLVDGSGIINVPENKRIER